MAHVKTKPTGSSVTAFLSSVDDAQKKRDCDTLITLMRKITGAAPKMWGPSIVGFGSFHYKYDSGREGDWFLTGFSPRRQDLTLYIMAGFSRYDSLMAKLGKYQTGKSCLHVKRLEDVDMEVLTKLIEQSVQHVARSYA